MTTKTQFLLLELLLLKLTRFSEDQTLGLPLLLDLNSYNQDNQFQNQLIFHKLTDLHKLLLNKDPNNNQLSLKEDLHNLLSHQRLQPSHQKPLLNQLLLLIKENLLSQFLKQDPLSLLLNPLQLLLLSLPDLQVPQLLKYPEELVLPLLSLLQDQPSQQLQQDQTNRKS